MILNLKKTRMIKYFTLCDTIFKYYNNEVYVNNFFV